MKTEKIYHSAYWRTVVKYCNKCQLEYPVETGWYPRKGRTSACRRCRKRYTLQYYYKNRVKISARSRQLHGFNESFSRAARDSAVFLKNRTAKAVCQTERYALVKKYGLYISQKEMEDFVASRGFDIYYRRWVSSGYQRTKRPCLLPKVQFEHEAHSLECFTLGTLSKKFRIVHKRPGLNQRTQAALAV